MCPCCIDFTREQSEDFRFAALFLQKADCLDSILMGQGQEGGSVSPHSCSFFTSFCNHYPEYRLLSRARVRRIPLSESQSISIARQEFLHFPESRSEFRPNPDPDDTLPDLDGQQAQNILNHP